MGSERERLPPNQRWAAPGKWPMVGDRQPRADDSPWILQIDGLVATKKTWTLDELRAMPLTELTLDLHCVTRWSMKDATFRGVRFLDLLDESGPLAEARFVSFVSRSRQPHSSSLSVDEVRQFAPLIALEFAGAPVTADHGGPIRLIVPGKYLFKSVKWLTRIELLAEDRLGYWEGEAGYHNHADPWAEERFIATNLDRRQVAELIQKRDFSNLDLLGLEVPGLDLQGLVARNAKIRNGNFRNAKLADANFEGANLSNAHLQGADLRNASFRYADAEGANFLGADLRGADFTGCYLTAATFKNELGIIGEFRDAIVDDTTILDGVPE